MKLSIKLNQITFSPCCSKFSNTSFTIPTDTYETNILGTHNILQAIKMNSPDTICHICSSSEVFGRVSRDKLPIKEDCSFHPASYEFLKLEQI